MDIGKSIVSGAKVTGALVKSLAKGGIRDPGSVIRHRELYPGSSPSLLPGLHPRLNSTLHIGSKKPTIKLKRPRLF